MLRSSWMVMGVLSLSIASTGANVASAQEAAEGPLHYFTVPPCRLFDTRLGGVPPLVTDTVIPAGSTTTRSFTVKGFCDVPYAARAVALNITVPGGNQSFLGHLVAYAAGTALPPTSNLNMNPFITDTNFAIVKVGTHEPDLNLTLVLADREVSSLGAKVHVVIDVVGYLK